MAENEYNDEYQFDNLDTMDSGSLGASDSNKGDVSSFSRKQKGEGGKGVLIKALIVVVIAVLLMLGYKFVGSFFSDKAKSATTTTEIPPPTETVSSVPPVEQQPPVQPAVQVQNTPPPVTEVDNSQVNQKLSSLEASQQSVQSDLSTVDSKLNGINESVGQLTEKIANINQMVTILTSKLEQQSSEIAMLTERTKPKLIPKIVIKRSEGLMYYIQAIIPGRAWLIATNGSTITVREGTQIAGYGVVKLIDPNQGRVITSSGQVIRFSQQDS